MWHASVSGRWSRDWRLLEEIARDELRRVGAPTAGEWVERGDIALHLRRRLTPSEMKQGGITQTCDVRGTEDARTRLARVRPFLPQTVARMPDEALP